MGIGTRESIRATWFLDILLYKILRESIKKILMNLMVHITEEKVRLDRLYYANTVLIPKSRKKKRSLKIIDR